MARRHSMEGGNHLEQESNRQRTMEGIDGGLHPAVGGLKKKTTPKTINENQLNERIEYTLALRSHVGREEEQLNAIW